MQLALPSSSLVRFVVLHSVMSFMSLLLSGREMRIQTLSYFCSEDFRSNSDLALKMYFTKDTWKKQF